MVLLLRPVVIAGPDPALPAEEPIDAAFSPAFIGSENQLFSLSGSSLIVAPFSDSDHKIVGVLGVIGPTRMNYARIIPMVDYTARLVGRLLT